MNTIVPDRLNKMRKQQLVVQPQQQQQQNNINKLLKIASVSADANQLLTPIMSKLPLTQKGIAQILQQKDAQRPERNLWHTSEVMEVLHIIKSSNALQMLNSKTVKNEKVFKQIEQIMRRNGFKKKSHIQIWTKWKFLRSTYTTSKRNDTIPRMIAPKIYDLLHEILNSSNAREETTSQTLTMHSIYNNDTISNDEDDLDPDYSSDDIRARRSLTTKNLKGNCKDNTDEPLIQATTPFNTDDSMSMAHPIFGFRLNNVKDEPADNGYETSTITDQISLVTETNDTSEDNCNSTRLPTEIKDELHGAETEDDINKSHDQDGSTEFITNDFPVRLRSLPNYASTSTKEINYKKTPPTRTSNELTQLPALIPPLPPLRLAPFSQVPMPMSILNRPPPPLALVNNKMTLAELRRTTTPPAKKTESLAQKRVANQHEDLRLKIMQMQQEAYSLRPDTQMPVLNVTLSPPNPKTVPTASQAKQRTRTPYNLYNTAKKSAAKAAGSVVQRKRRLEIPWPSATLTPETAPKRKKLPMNASTPYSTTAQAPRTQSASPLQNESSNSKKSQNTSETKLWRKQQKLMEKTMKELNTAIHEMQRDMLKDFFNKQMQLAQKEHEFQSQQDILLMRAFQEQTQALLNSANRLLGLNAQQQRDQHRQQQQQQQELQQQHNKKKQQQQQQKQKQKQQLAKKTQKIYRQQTAAQKAKTDFGTLMQKYPTTTTTTKGMRKFQNRASAAATATAANAMNDSDNDNYHKNEAEEDNDNDDEDDDDDDDDDSDSDSDSDSDDAVDNVHEPNNSAYVNNPMLYQTVQLEDNVGLDDSNSNTSNTDLQLQQQQYTADSNHCDESDENDEESHDKDPIYV